MPEERVYPHDDKTMHHICELMIQTRFDKEKGGLVKIKTELFQANGKNLEPETMAYMLVCGLAVWCERVNPQTDYVDALLMRNKIQPLLTQMLEVINFINPEKELKNLFSQIDKQNAGNTDNSPGLPKNPEGV